MCFYTNLFLIFIEEKYLVWIEFKAIYQQCFGFVRREVFPAVYRGTDNINIFFVQYEVRNKMASDKYYRQIVIEKIRLSMVSNSSISTTSPAYCWLSKPGELKGVEVGVKSNLNII